MGKLRKSFHREVADRVIAEINKTLTNHPVDRMEEVIAGS
jgi:protein required for attachment to host cells